MNTADRRFRTDTSALLIAGVLILALAGVPAPAGAEVISQTYAFPEPTVETVDGYAYVRIEGLTEAADPGEPLLPVEGAKILLPPGEEVVDIQVIPGTIEILEGTHRVAPGQMQYPLSLPRPEMVTGPDPGIYESAAAYPPEVAVHVTTERLRGYDIAFIRLHPVRYTPATGELAFYRRVEVRVLTAPSTETLEGQRAMFRADPGTVGRVSRLVDNPGAETRYPEVMAPSGQRDADTYPYLVITDDPYVSILQDLADFKTQRGLRAKIVRVDSLTANVTGNDAQDKIRNYITEAYQNFGTEWVLLAGDEEIIPSRKLYVSAFGGAYIDYGMASDLYYGGLDGNWNSDGDGYWGEPGEADLVPEVHVGRAPIDNTTEATNFVAKTLKYQQDPVLSECTLALMVGELLWDDPTFGGDYMEEIRLGASTHGYTTVGFPAQFACDTLYDRGPANPTWDKNDLIPLLNGGTHLVNHLGHSSNLYSMRMYDTDVDSRFTNDGETHSYFIIYTQGCYCNAFDNRTSSGTYTTDAISEYFVTVENAAVAFVGNTRYGFGAHLSTNGSSQRFHREFVDAIFGEDVYHLAAMNDDSKVDNIPVVDVEGNRWCYYQVCVMGDPELPVWTNVPTALALSHDGTCCVGQNEYEVQVTSGRGPVEGALACMYTADGDVYATGTTNASGYAYLDPSPTHAGSGTLVVSAHDCLVTEEPFTIEVSSDPYLVCSETVIDDDQTAPSAGNADGAPDAGETIELDCELENVGETEISGVYAILSSEDTFAQTTTDSAYYGTIPSGSSAYGHAPFVVEVGARCPDGHELPLELTIEGGRSHGVRHLLFAVGAPKMEMVAYETSDLTSGDGDGCLGPSEIVDLTVTIENTGTEKAYDVVGTLTASDPYVSLVTGTAEADSVAVGGQADLAFQVQIDPGCPTPYLMTVPVEFYASTGEISNDLCTIQVTGALETDFEDGEVGYWTHEAVTPGYVDEWHLTDLVSYPDGTHSWKCGAYDGNYADYSDGGLVSPGVCLSGSDTLEFWHRMRAEEGSSTTAWDGGFVEISLDGGDTWQQITPIGGYPYTIIDNPASPFDPGTPCWSGIKAWEFAEFDLAAFTGPANFRFRFGSDGYVTYVGWWIDQVVLRTETETGARDEIALLDNRPTEFALSQNHPNPFNPVTTVRYAIPKESAVSIRVYNVLGQQVRVLVDEVRPAGYHEAVWNGADERGREVSSGIYFCRMDAEGYRAVKRMILLK